MNGGASGRVGERSTSLSAIACASVAAFCAADCAALPFEDATFDVVVSFETLEHIAAQDA